METNYDVHYFINKFEGLHESEIGYSQDEGCAYGQCQSLKGYKDGSQTIEGISLTENIVFYKGVAAKIWV